MTKKKTSTKSALEPYEIASDRSMIGREFVWEDHGNLYKGPIKHLTNYPGMWEIDTLSVDLEWTAIKVQGSSAWAIIADPVIPEAIRGEIDSDGNLVLNNTPGSRCMILAKGTYYPPKRVLGRK